MSLKFGKVSSGNHIIIIRYELRRLLLSALRDQAFYYAKKSILELLALR